MADIVKTLNDAIQELQVALNTELSNRVVANVEVMVESTPADISSRYWLMQFLEKLNRKELKSVVDGFLVQLLNEEQCKKLVKFLLVRFPGYYTDITGQITETPAPEPSPNPSV